MPARPRRVGGAGGHPHLTAAAFTAAEVELDDPLQPLRVSADGQFANFSVDTTDHLGITYVQQSWSFVADDASATLEFRSLTDDITANLSGVQGYGAVIDNVSATVVPAPAAHWLLGTGMAAPAGMARRRGRISA